jgi:Na+-driven multidrug efflux pump
MTDAGVDGGQTSIIRLAAPLVVSFVLRSLFTLVDTFYAAQLGDEAVAAIGLTIPLELAFIATWVGCSNALTSLLGRAMGARESERVTQLKRAGYTVICAVAPVFVLLGAGCWWAAPHLGLDAELERGFAIYATVLVAGTGLTGFWSIVPDSVVKMHHDTRSTMIAGLWSNVVNVTLNTLFLFAFGWGIFGIAFSTVIGRLAGLAYAMRRARALEAERQAAWSGAAVPGRYAHPIRRIVLLAIPASLGTLLLSTETGVANLLLKRLDDATAAVAAFGIYYRFLFLGLMPLIATSVALLPFVARHWGARNLGVIRRGVREVMVVGTALVVCVVGPLYVLGAGTIVGWLTESEAAYDYSVWALRFTPVMVLVSFPFFVVRPVFEGMQRFGPGLVVATLRHLAFAVPGAVAGIVLAPRWGLEGFHGLLLGFAGASALASWIFMAWGWRLLRRDSPTHPEPLPSTVADPGDKDRRGC